MSDDKRACVAAIVVTINGIRVQSLYDYNYNSVKVYSIAKSGNNIQIYDLTRNSYMAGFMPNFYDYKTSSYVQVNVNGNVFSGFDYQTSTFFNGYILGKTISIFDGQTSKSYAYGF